MRTAIVSTYPPRVCGIGTFAADVHAGLLGVAGLDGVERVVIVDEQTRPERAGVTATIAQGVRGDYVRAARLLGRLDVDVVLLQHEYGIFGGRDGDYVLSLAEELSQPLVVTLHTVLEEPGRHRAAVLESLCDKAELVIVMTESAATLLEAGGACPAEKIRVVPHGAPAVLLRRAAENRNGRRSRYAAGRPRRPPRRALPAVDVRVDLGRQGDRDGDRSAAVDRRAPSAGALPGRRSDPPRRRAPRG